MTEPQSDDDSVSNGTIREIEGRERIYYDGYWIRYYSPPAETLTAKKNLIANLTRRTFHHTESGINTPGENLELARIAYDKAEREEEKRVNAAMLAGALFNRATDIFTIIVELADKGVNVRYDNQLMNECSEYLSQAMELGKSVRHFSGSEGIDELWGEPLKAFTLSLSDFYESRYIKISMSMREIDRIYRTLSASLSALDFFDDAREYLKEFAEFAKRNSEIMRTDADHFQLWPRFVATAEKIENFIHNIPEDIDPNIKQHIVEGCDLLNSGRLLIGYISGARVPMPGTTERLLNRCKSFDELTAAISGESS